MSMKQGDRLFDNVDVLKIPEREYRVLNALDVCIHRCLYKYELIFQIIDKNKTELDSTLVLITWELIDWLDRTRKILGYGAGLNKKDPDFILTYQQLDKAEDFRHILQHFDGFINKTNGNSYAPLGAVTAINWLGDKGQGNEFKILTFTVGNVRGVGVDLGSVEMPEIIKEKVDYVTLQFEDEKLNISEIAYKLLPFYESLRETIEIKYPKT